MNYEIKTSQLQQMNESFQSLFGARLKAERKRLAFNQQQAADTVGVTREHWGRCERGQAVLGGEALAAFAAAGGNVQYVLAGEQLGENSARLTAEEQTVLAFYRQASLEVRRAALGALVGAQAQSAGSADMRGMTMNNHSPGGVQVGVAMGSVKTTNKLPKT